jgi:type I restriction enzyme S subunit
VHELALIRTGPFGTLLKASEYSTSDGVPLISVGEIGTGRINVTERTPLVPEAVIRRLPQYLLRHGDIVFGRKGAVERSAIVTEKENGWFLGSDGIRVRLQRECDPFYLAWQFQRSKLQAWLLQNATGTTMASLNQTTLGRVQIPYPPPTEQRTIATVLSDVDALLNALERLITKKRDLKRAAMQQLLTGKTRLPGFSGEWEVKSLFELAEYKKEFFDDGDWIEAEFLTDKGIRLVQTGNIGEGHFAEKDATKYISADSFQKLRCKDVQVGDILICRLADPAGRACILPNIGEDRVITAVDVTIFRPAILRADRQFLVNVFSTPQWFQSVSERCGGTTRTRIARGELGKMQIKLPTLAEQAAVAAVLTDMDAELAALEQRLAKTRDIKQAMMQELLTGKTRLLSPQEAHA